MAFVLIFLGIIFAVAGIRGTQGDLYTLLGGDFFGKGSFLYWVVAIVAVGSLGYIEATKGFARYFMALMFVVLFLGTQKRTGKSFFTELNTALAGTTPPTPSSDNPASPTGTPKTGPATYSTPRPNAGPYQTIDELIGALMHEPGGEGAMRNLQAEVRRAGAY